MNARPTFSEALTQGPLVFDGATGTMLYDRGVYLTHSFDALCLSKPELVLEVQREYVEVGVDVLQTNTFGANPFALSKHGHEDKCHQICSAGVQIARRAADGRCYVGGSVGPTGLLPKDLLRNRIRRQALDAFHDVTSVLTSEGVDVLVFESFGYLGELEIAIEAAYDATVPIVAQVSFDENGMTQDGATAREVAERLAALGVDMIGANCILGPEKTLEILTGITDIGIPLIMQPNAGFPRTIDGRAIYNASPETFGVVARRAYKQGIKAVGGCCGTTPEHIRRVVAAAKMMGGGARVARTFTQKTTPEPRTKLAERSRFGSRIAKGEFVVSVEISPPVGLQVDKTIAKIRALEGRGVDVVNIPDGPRATVRMSNIAFAKLVLDSSNMEPLVHFCARDRNLLGLQSDLLGAHALGIRNLVIVTGDPPKVGDYPHASAVFDLDSIGMLDMASGLNAAIDPAKKSMDSATSFVLATGVEPAAIQIDREVERLEEKVRAGANLVMTQPVYDPKTLHEFLKRIQHIDIPVIVGVLPLASVRNAEFLSKNVPGMHVPEPILDRLRCAKDPRQEGVKIAGEMLATVKPDVQGVYLMPPFGNIDLATGVLEYL